jgi:hypothetical protein
MSRSTKPAAIVPVAEAFERLGWSDLAPGIYDAGTDDYGQHFRRVLPCGQYIDYTITAPFRAKDGSVQPGGKLLERVNFVPSKDKKTGTSLYGKQWQSVVAYRQAADYLSDMALFESRGMLAESPDSAPRKAASSKFKAIV